MATPPEESTSINDLPEAILLHIISFIWSDEAVKTSAVAPSWRNLWHSVPILDFDMRTFHSKMPQKSTGEACLLFNQFITDTLFRHRPRHLSLHKFKLFLSCGNNSHTLNNFGLWLRFVIKAKVVVLDLKFTRFSTNDDTDKDDDDIFNSGSTILTQLVKSSVMVLKLQGIYFEVPNEPLRLKSIREVHLENFRCKDEDIADLIVSCVHLESLSLMAPAESCSLKNLKIVSQKLKILTLNEHWNICSVEICAPSMVSLNLKYVCAEKFSLMESSSLVEAKVLCLTYYDVDLNYFATLVSCLSGVERLTIQNMWRNWLINAPQYKCQLRPPGDRVFSETFVYHNLKHVKLLTSFSQDDIFGLQSLLKQCPQLEILVLVYEYGSKYENYILDDMPADFYFRIPHLRLVEMKEYRGCEMEEYVVGLLKKHGVVLEKIVAHPRCANGESPPPFVL